MTLLGTLVITLSHFYQVIVQLAKGLVKVLLNLFQLSLFVIEDNLVLELSLLLIEAFLKLVQYASLLVELFYKYSLIKGALTK